MDISEKQLIKLQNIERLLSSQMLDQKRIVDLMDTSKMSVMSAKTSDGWTLTQKGNLFEYQREITMTGAAQNIDCAVPFACMIRRWDTWTDDATAKSYTLDVYSGTVTATSYTRLDNVAVDTNQSNSFTSDKADSYLQAPLLLRTAVTVSTNGKKMTIKILVER